MTTASTDLAYPGDVKCYDCGREILIDSATVYALEEGNTLSPLCEKCAERRRRAAAVKIAKVEEVEKWD